MQRKEKAYMRIISMLLSLAMLLSAAPITPAAQAEIGESYTYVFSQGTEADVILSKGDAFGDAQDKENMPWTYKDSQANIVATVKDAGNEDAYLQLSTKDSRDNYALRFGIYFRADIEIPEDGEYSLDLRLWDSKTGTGNASVYVTPAATEDVVTAALLSADGHMTARTPEYFAGEFDTFSDADGLTAHTEKYTGKMLKAGKYAVVFRIGPGDRRQHLNLRDLTLTKTGEYKEYITASYNLCAAAANTALTAGTAYGSMNTPADMYWKVSDGNTVSTALCQVLNSVFARSYIKSGGAGNHFSVDIYVPQKGEYDINMFLWQQSSGSSATEVSAFLAPAAASDKIQDKYKLGTYAAKHVKALDDFEEMHVAKSGLMLSPGNYTLTFRVDDGDKYFYFNSLSLTKTGDYVAETQYVYDFTTQGGWGAALEKNVKYGEDGNDNNMPWTWADGNVNATVYYTTEAWSRLQLSAAVSGDLPAGGYFGVDIEVPEAGMFDLAFLMKNHSSNASMTDVYIAPADTANPMAIEYLLGVMNTRDENASCAPNELRYTDVMLKEGTYRVTLKTALGSLGTTQMIDKLSIEKTGEYKEDSSSYTYNFVQEDGKALVKNQTMGDSRNSANMSWTWTGGDPATVTQYHLGKASERLAVVNSGAGYDYTVTLDLPEAGVYNAKLGMLDYTWASTSVDVYVAPAGIEDKTAEKYHAGNYSFRKPNKDGGDLSEHYEDISGLTLPSGKINVTFRVAAASGTAQLYLNSLNLKKTGNYQIKYNFPQVTDPVNSEIGKNIWFGNEADPADGAWAFTDGNTSVISMTTSGEAMSRAYMISSDGLGKNMAKGDFVSLTLKVPVDGKYDLSLLVMDYKYGFDDTGIYLAPKNAVEPMNNAYKLGNANTRNSTADLSKREIVYKGEMLKAGEYVLSFKAEKEYGGQYFFFKTLTLENTGIYVNEYILNSNDIVDGEISAYIDADKEIEFTAKLGREPVDLANAELSASVASENVAQVKVTENNTLIVSGKKLGETTACRAVHSEQLPLRQEIMK